MARNQIPQMNSSFTARHSHPIGWMGNKGYAYRNIVVTEEVYKELKRRGQAGDSFNDVLKRMLGLEVQG